MVEAHVVIYTTPSCGYCHWAKRLLRDKLVDFEEIAVSGRRDMRVWLREVSGQHTVPQIFINGDSIGGYDELSDLDRRGLLDARLAVASSETDPVLRR